MRISYFLFIAAWLFVTATAQAADRLILRAGAQIIRDRTVVAMSFDGVKLDDGTLFGWDEIEAGRLEGNRQELFDKYLKNVGIDLFRIRHRLGVGDYRSLTPHAETIAKYYEGRDSDAAYMVMQALMWGRLAEGRREAAVAPYWRCFEYLRTRQTEAVKLPGERRLKYDPATGMCAELAPIWFDAESAKAALPEAAAAIAAMKEPRPDGTRVYYATLALAADDDKNATQALAGIDGQSGPLAELRDIIAAQREVLAGVPDENVKQLASKIDTLAPANRPLGLYWLGMAQVLGDDAAQKQRGVLQLLHLPAVYGSEHPELAAAGLFQAMKTLEELDDVRGSIALRSELLTKYDQTQHAGRVDKTGED